MAVPVCNRGLLLWASRLCAGLTSGLRKVIYKLQQPTYNSSRNLQNEYATAGRAKRPAPGQSRPSGSKRVRFQIGIQFT